MKYFMFFVVIMISFNSRANVELGCNNALRNAKNIPVIVHSVVIKDDWGLDTPHVVVINSLTNTHHCVRTRDKKILNIIYSSLFKRDALRIDSNENYDLTSIVILN